MKIGTVKWFNNEKGYGFIRNTTTDEDILCISRELRKKDSSR